MVLIVDVRGCLKSPSRPPESAFGRLWRSVSAVTLPFWDLRSSPWSSTSTLLRHPLELLTMYFSVFPVRRHRAGRIEVGENAMARAILDIAKRLSSAARRTPSVEKTTRSNVSSPMSILSLGRCSIHTKGVGNLLARIIPPRLSLPLPSIGHRA